MLFASSVLLSPFYKYILTGVASLSCFYSLFTAAIADSPHSPAIACLLKYVYLPS